MNTTQLATRIVSAWGTRAQIPAISNTLKPFDLSAGYTVQESLVDLLQSKGRVIAGAKIGLSDPRSFAAMGVSEPLSGILFEDMQMTSGQVLPSDCFADPRVEAELCLTLGADLDKPDMTVDEVARAITSIAPAIEIVDSRWSHWAATIPDIVAENISASFYVCGTAVDGFEPDTLAAAKMTMQVDGEIVATGDAAAAFGSPVKALHWLARDLLKRGRPLRSGHHVMSGAFARMSPVNAGQSVSVKFPGIGSVDVSFAAK